APFSWRCYLLPRRPSPEGRRDKLQLTRLIRRNLNLKCHHFGLDWVLVLDKALAQHVVERGGTGPYFAVDLPGQGLCRTRSQQQRNTRFERRERVLWHDETTLAAQHAQQIESFPRGASWKERNLQVHAPRPFEVDFDQVRPAGRQHPDYLAAIRATAHL